MSILHGVTPLYSAVLDDKPSSDCGLSQLNLKISARRRSTRVFLNMYLYIFMFIYICISISSRPSSFFLLFHFFVHTEAKQLGSR